MLCFAIVLLFPFVECGGLFRIESMKSKHEFLRNGLLSRGWRELKKGQIEPGFLWSFRWQSSRPERQFVNHFGNHLSISTKWGLLASLGQQESSTSWFPRGYLWPRDKSPLVDDFHRTIASCSGQELDPVSHLPPLQPEIDCGAATGRMWIAKPASGTRGVGIEVFQDLQLMENFLGGQEGEFVVQKYIEAPMLLFDRKFDLRQFVLVVSLDPLIVFCSLDTYVRFASATFAGGGSTDPFVHLTNAQIQKFAPRNAEQDAADVARGIDRNQWSLDSLKSYLDAK
jgi:hypothetical protein